MIRARRSFFPPVLPTRFGRLAVGGRHELHFEECGNPLGKPVVVLHGGPGGGTSPLLRRELAIGLVNALLGATIVSVVTAVFFRDWRVAGVIAAATAANLLIAAAVGFGVPLALRRLRIDPALAGSVILITVTDLVGFVAVLGLGTLLLT